jgi:hypothetical protein
MNGSEEGTGTDCTDSSVDGSEKATGTDCTDGSVEIVEQPNIIT